MNIHPCGGRNELFSVLLLRDDGIVIAISFWQWLVELFFNLGCISVIIGLGTNRQVDHFLTLTGIGFAMCVLPLFYFMACASFRRDLESYGFVKAFLIAVTRNYSEITPISD